MTEQPRLLAVKPIITYPREAQVGKTYLMTIDLQPEEGFEWQYEEEEYPIYCMIDSDLFNSKPVGEPVLVLHRFGESYGEAKIYLTATQDEREGNIKVTLINRWGVPIETIGLSSIKVTKVAFLEETDQNLLTQSLSEKNKGTLDEQVTQDRAIDASRQENELMGGNLEGLDLHDFDFSHANLQNRNLSRAGLRGSNLENTNLSNAVLINTDLSLTNLRDADLTQANLSLAVLIDADLSGANLSGANLNFANLSRAKLSNTDLTGANLTGANLSYALLDSARLNSARLRGARLNNARLDLSKLDNADLYGAELHRVSLRRASLVRANLMFVSLKQALLVDATLSGADLSGADLSGSDLRSADLSGAKLRVAIFDGANLSETRLLRANLSDASLQNCLLAHSKLNRAYLSGANLKYANLHSADLGGANLLCADLNSTILQNVSLVRAYLSNSILNNVDLRDANLKNATLFGVNLDTAQVSDAVFEGNAGLGEIQHSDLLKRGASLTALPSLQINEENSLNLIRSFDEARSDLNYRLLDLEEALQMFEGAISILRSALQQQKSFDNEQDLNKITQVVAVFEEEGLRFNQEIEEYRSSISNLDEETPGLNLKEWTVHEFSEELNDIHIQILKLRTHTELINHVWKSLLNMIQEDTDSNEDD